MALIWWNNRKQENKHRNTAKHLFCLFKKNYICKSVIIMSILGHWPQKVWEPLRKHHHRSITMWSTDEVYMVSFFLIKIPDRIPYWGHGMFIKVPTSNTVDSIDRSLALWTSWRTRGQTENNSVTRSIIWCQQDALLVSSMFLLGSRLYSLYIYCTY